MSYFSDRYHKIRLAIKDDDNPGLRSAQLGAIHSIAAHFTIRFDPAIITMPTGSGKTAVLVLSSYLLRSKRVLVLTPSVLVRDQIIEEFKTLRTLKECGCIPSKFKSPKTKKITKKITSIEQWFELEKYDVCVSTPNVSSPGIRGVIKPPDEIFDLILVDEAHHSPAKTWAKLLNSIPNAKIVLFTATPFRKDKKEIHGSFIYTYPLRKAYNDGIFGDLEYVPVKWDSKEDPDKSIAKFAEIVYYNDQNEGKLHRLMVRTDSKKRANELFKIYEDNTNLNLQVIHSGYSYKHVKRAIKALKEGTLDGIICVSMLGEGFDFPQLKIAAIHTPHKSLEVTLQFIGRFARTNTEKIGTAKFLAIPNQIKFEAERLYVEDSTWQEIIANLSETKIEMEARVRQDINTFRSAGIIDFDLKNLSIYALHPYTHVKIYSVNGDVDLEAIIKLPTNFEIVYSRYSPELSTLILITRESLQPKWSRLDLFNRIEYDLFIIYHHIEAELIFINSSRRSTSMYEMVAKSICLGNHRILELFRINRILRDLEQIDCFNIGMRNRVRSTNTESYRIIAGSHAQEAVKKSDGRLFHRGHIFAKANKDNKSITIGFSSGSKVWMNQNLQIPLLVEWCKNLGDKINYEGIIKTNTNLDNIESSKEIAEIPEGIVAVDWHDEIYKYPWRLKYKNERNAVCEVLDCELKLGNTDNQTIDVTIVGPLFEVIIKFDLNSSSFFGIKSPADTEIRIFHKDDIIDLVDFLNNYPFYFYTWNFAWFSGKEYFPAPVEFSPYNRDRIIKLDWEANQVDITNEFQKATNQSLSIHDFILKYLSSLDVEIVFYDHGPGEKADIITVKSYKNYIEVVFYHCKSSKEKKPGNRVADIYEVTGQVIKSTHCNNYKKLQSHLRRRLNRGSVFVKGDMRILEKCFEMTPLLPMNTKIALIQPGISSALISDKNMNIIAAADDFVRGAGGVEMVVIGSE